MARPPNHLPILLCAFALAPSGCGDHPVSYHEDAAPLLQRYCTSCHYPGGIGPFALTDYQAAQVYAQPMRQALDSGRMPPWLPDDAGLPLRYSRKMRSQDRDLLLRWIDAGAPEGDSAAPPRADIPPAETVAPPRPDVKLDPGQPYLPNAAMTDDYRCFVVSDPLDHDIYVHAGNIYPGQANMVHHVIVFSIAPEGVPKIQSLLGKDGQAGFSCFGGAGADDSEQVVLAWAPGGTPIRFPANTALKVDKGSLLLLQVHYNLLNSHGAADRTTAELEISTTPPAQQAQMWTLADPEGLHIKAGDAHARQVINLQVWEVQAYYNMPPGNLLAYGSAPHMHLLGKRIATSVQGGATLLEVPQWDFHWQQGYIFQQPYELRPEDTLTVECDYDNSAANQPLLNGQRQQPRDLGWGEGTKDEMCLSFLYVAPEPK